MVGSKVVRDAQQAVMPAHATENMWAPTITSKFPEKVVLCQAAALAKCSRDHLTACIMRGKQWMAGSLLFTRVRLGITLILQRVTTVSRSIIATETIFGINPSIVRPWEMSFGTREISQFFPLFDSSRRSSQEVWGEYILWVLPDCCRPTTHSPGVFFLIVEHFLRKGNCSSCKILTKLTMLREWRKQCFLRFLVRGIRPQQANTIFSTIF